MHYGECRQVWCKSILWRKHGRRLNVVYVRESSRICWFVRQTNRLYVHRVPWYKESIHSNGYHINDHADERNGLNDDSDDRRWWHRRCFQLEGRGGQSIEGRGGQT